MADDFFSERRWFLVVAKPRQEARARDNLHRSGYRVWLPQCLELRTHARKTEEVKASLFGRYLFVGVEEEQSFPAILTTPGVSFVVGTGGVMSIPLEIPYAGLRELRRLRAAIDKDGGALDLRPKATGPRFKKGDAVRAVDGPFAGFVGKVKRAKGGRVEALMTVFGRETQVQYEERSLEPVA